MQKKNYNSGITLIALIITIIVILILVAVTVRTAVNSGLFGHAKNAVEKWAEAQEQEVLMENDIANMLNQYITGNTENNNSNVEDPKPEEPERVWELVETVTSPNYPESYPDNIFQVTERTYSDDIVGVKVVFKELFIEMDEWHRFDRVTIKDKNNNFIAVLCGRGKPAITLDGNYIKLSFLTDYANSYRGYSAQIYTTKNKTLVQEELASQNISLPNAIYFDERNSLKEEFELDVDSLRR